MRPAEPLPKLAALPPVQQLKPQNDSVNAPIAMFSRHNGGWTVVFSIADPTLGISWRLGEAGDFRETGFMDTLDPRTRKRMPNPSVELPADAPAAIIQVRYVDTNGELQGPFPIRFDPEAALIRDQRKILDMTATSWLSFREFNGLLVYYTHLMSYRCAIREVRVGIDFYGARQGGEDAALQSPGSQRDSARRDAVSEALPADQVGVGGVDLSRRQRVGDQEFSAVIAASKRRHLYVIASVASYPSRSGPMDCFAALAMGMPGASTSRLAFVTIARYALLPRRDSAEIAADFGAGKAEYFALAAG